MTVYRIINTVVLSCGDGVRRGQSGGRCARPERSGGRCARPAAQDRRTASRATDPERYVDTVSLRRAIIVVGKIDS